MPDLVSIGMAVHNGAATLPLALRSLLAQSHADWELLLLDDGSDDDTAERVADFADPRIRFVRDGQRRGLAARMNQAVAMAGGRYFARMDGDDIAYPERLERQIAHLNEHPEMDLVGSAMLVFGAGGEPLGGRFFPTGHTEICARPFEGFPLAHPTWLGKIEWFRAHRYDERLAKAQDYELLLRSYRDSRFANLPEILLGYREAAIEPRKQLATRQAVARVLRARGCHGAALRQILKGGVDLLAAASGLGHRLLRHRAVPLDATARERWRSVWAACQGSPG